MNVGSNLARSRHGMFVAALTGLIGGCAAPPSDPAKVAPLEAYKQRTVELHVYDSLIRITSAPRETPGAQADVQLWVSSAAQAVETYYGRFPVRSVNVIIETTDGQGPQSGTTFGFGTPTIRMSVGRASLPEDFPRDWMMTHEMVHLAFPRVPQEHHWIEEGLATYVEPIARAQAGQLPPQHVWLDLIEGLPHGLPRAGDRGLDLTPTWGRTYWGGALYCLLADIKIRERSNNQYGLQDALRGVLAGGGNIQTIWPIKLALQTGDEAVGQTVLVDLYEQMRAAPVDVDLDAMWRSLGVKLVGRQVVFDDDAPLAPIRRAITAAPHG
jgi:hypothetical protein